jgi:hypothetical protein
MVNDGRDTFVSNDDEIIGGKRYVINQAMQTIVSTCATAIQESLSISHPSLCSIEHPF